MSLNTKHLFCFGLGFSGLALARLIMPQGWKVSGTVRSEAKAEALAAEGIQAFVLDASQAQTLAAPIVEALAQSTHVLQSVGTAKDGHDPVLPLVKAHRHAFDPEWVGYLSTTVVYGDWQGQWVDETSETRSQSARGLARLEAEKDWCTFDWPLHIFRLAGIYGPGRNALETVKAGRARIIDKPGQVFSRIHVQDIASSVFASMQNPAATNSRPAIYNVCDDLPSAPGEVIEMACQMLGYPAPIPMTLEEANLSAMGRSFYEDNKRVRNTKLKTDLGWKPAFPTYKEGLAAIFSERESWA